MRAAGALSLLLQAVKLPPSPLITCRSRLQLHSHAGQAARALLSPSLPPVRVNARVRDANSEPRSHYCIPFTSADCSAAHMRDCFISAAEPPRFDLNRCRDHRAAATERARMAVAKPAKDTFVLSCATAYTATGMYLHPQMKMQNASLGLMRSLKRSAEASPEDHAAILHGIEKRGLLQRAQSVAS